LNRLALVFGLVLLALEAAVAVYLVATSTHASDSTATLGLAVTGGVAFVVSGLVAIARRPENRTGVYLAAVGYAWFLGALQSANDPWLYSIGLVVGPIVFGPLTALALVHPTGRFDSRLERAVPWLVVMTLVGLASAISLVDPDPELACDDCPENKLNVVDAPALGDALVTVIAVAAISLVVLVAAFMARRWRRASPALRRSLRPVYLALAAVLSALFVEGLTAELFTQDTANAFSPLFFLSFIAVPLSFLYGILRTRLARASAADLMLALQDGTPLREALADALGDPTLLIAYRVPGTSRWVDAEGQGVPEPVPSPGRAQRAIEHAGLPVAVLDYDVHLADERELVDGVTAAASLLLQNERLYAGARAQYAFLETITDTAPSLLVNVGIDGRILNQNQAAVDVVGATDQEHVRGRFFWDVFIDPSERRDVIARFRASAPTFPPAEYENTFTNQSGEKRIVYWRSAPVLAEDGTVLSIIAGGLDITDRERLAEEKEREREFLNAIANNAPSLLCLIDERGVVAELATNIAFERTLEYATEETGGHVFWERYVDPGEAAEVEALIGRVVAGEPVGEHDNQWVTRSGRRLLIAWTCTALPQIDERRLFLLSGVDVTERKERELELQRERDVQTTVFESMPSIMVVLAPDGTIRDRNFDDPRVGANRAFIGSIRWPDEDIVGRPFLDLVVEDEDGRAARAIAMAAAGETSEQVESELRSGDGSARTFAWSATPIADITARLEQLVLVCGVDVTERRERELELQRERDFLSATANSIPTLLALVDEEGVVTERGVNAAFERVLGYRQSEVVGRSIWEVLAPEEERAELHASFRRCIEAAAPSSIESRWQTRDGDVRLVEWTTIARPGGEDSAPQYLISANDVTVRRRQEEEIRASRARIVRAEDEARRALERNLHDGAQQRLVALSVGLRLVESKLRESPEEAAALLAGSREELAHALEELRELARGIHPAVLTDRGLGPALEALAMRAPIPVELEAPAERLAPAVEAAAYYVVAESLTNVAKYGRATAAEVSVATVNGTLEVTVSDDGVGGADPDRGSGLRGLADRVEALEGHLTVESPVGRGTKIRAEIPLHPVRPTPG
jgi:PAS domain S-box-containing protein